MKLNSVKFKIGVLYTVILGIILILYSSFLYFSLYNTLYSDLDNELINKVENITEHIKEYLEILDGDEKALIFAARRIITLKGEYPGAKRNLTSKQIKKVVDFEKKWTLKFDKLDLSEDFIHLIKNGGQLQAKSKNVSPELRAVFLKQLKKKKKERVALSKIKFKKKNLRLIQAPLKFQEKGEYIIQIGSSQKPVIELLEQRRNILFISIPVILILTSFVGQSLATRILSPVAEITQTAKNITHEDLSRRLKAKNVDEEMLTLTEAFNDMIARLENSFKHIGEFSSHVAHELKTPIAIMRGECEIALRKTRTVDEYKRVLKVNLDEAKRMLKTVDDLLLLAKLDYRPEIFKFKKFSLNKFFKEIHEQSSILASEKKIKVALDMPESEIAMNGDRLHLRRLFFNIIHNAVKFTPKNGRIGIKVQSQGNNLIASIYDSGVGIAKEDIPMIFERFFQKETGQINTQEPSNGLGLNIALSIAKLHQGNITVQSLVDEGTTFTIALPLT